MAVTVGCQAPRTAGSGVHAESAALRQGSQRSTARNRLSPVCRVICLFDQKPWLNLDVSGDRDPEGIYYRVFLDAGDNKGVHRNGTLRVEMYQIDRNESGEVQRTLVSDWELPTSGFQPVKSKMIGMGYHVRLVWARKDIPGHEVELITQYRDPDGNVVRSGTKRLRVPKYTP